MSTTQENAIVERITGLVDARAIRAIALRQVLVETKLSLRIRGSLLLLPSILKSGLPVKGQRHANTSNESSV